jgi:porin
MHLPGRLWPTLATLLCFVAAPPASAEEVDREREIYRHEQHSPAQRKVPHRRSGETRSPNGLSKPWWKWEHATGDWNGWRGRADNGGVTAELTYTGEVFGNLRGGIDSAGSAEYRGNVDVTFTADTQRLRLWPGGTAFVYLQNGHGSGITTDHVGDVQTISNIDADDFSQVSEYWFEQNFFEQRLRIKLGKQDANADFCALDYAGDFINSSFGLIPTVPLPTFPDPGLGAVAFVEPASWFTLGAGLYDGDARGGTSGFDTTFDGGGGLFWVVEAALSAPLVPTSRRQGTYRVGGWQHTDDVEEITAAATPKEFSHNHGVYLALDQPLFEESAGAEEPQGLAAFAQFGWAPEDRNELTWYWGGGFTYTGAVPTRDGDVLGIGVAHVRFSDRVKKLDGRTDETVVEVFYRARLTAWFSLQPDLQFVANPGGDGRNALAVGLRFGIDL